MTGYGGPQPRAAERRKFLNLRRTAGCPDGNAGVILRADFNGDLPCRQTSLKRFTTSSAMPA